MVITFKSRNIVRKLKRRFIWNSCVSLNTLVMCDKAVARYKIDKEILSYICQNYKTLVKLISNQVQLSLTEVSRT